MMDLFLTNTQLLSSRDITWWTGVVWITCGLLWCFYQLFGLSFWRHPFTAEHPLLSKWWNDTFLQIWIKKTIYTLSGLRVSILSVSNYFYNTDCMSCYCFPTKIMSLLNVTYQNFWHGQSEKNIPVKAYWKSSRWDESCQTFYRLTVIFKDANYSPASDVHILNWKYVSYGMWFLMYFIVVTIKNAYFSMHLRV